MKRMMKKLAAIALAGAMVLSLSVTALAGDGDENNAVGATGNATGTVTSQGQLPQNVVKVKMPTTAANTFNMYVDPHNLIRESKNAMDVAGGGEAVELFATDTLLYFANKTEGQVTGFSKTSDEIKVTNMSNIPVTVGMKATWTMGGNNSYGLAKDETDFAAAKTAGKPVMYLTLDDTLGHSAAVVGKDKGTPTLTYAAAPPQSPAVTSGNTNKLQYLDKYINSIDFAFTSDASEDDIKLLNEGGDIYNSSGTSTGSKTPTDWAITFAKSDKKTPTVTFDAGQLPTYPTLTGTGANQSVKKDNVYKVTYTEGTTTQTTQNVAISDTLNLDGSHTYSVPNGKAQTKINIVRGTTSPIVATITIDWNYEAIAQNGYNITEDLEDSTNSSNKDTYTMKVTGASGEGAKLSNDLNTIEGSYKLSKDAQSGSLVWALNDEQGFAYTDADKFQSVAFTLTGAITDGDVCAKAWDDAFAVADTSTLNLVWTISECDAVDPSAEVTTALTSNTGTAELKVDWGYGDSKTTTISAASYTVNGAATALPLDNVAIDENTVTITSVAALFAEAGANGVITLTFNNPDTGYSKDVTVDLKTAAA